MKREIAIDLAGRDAVADPITGSHPVANKNANT
jgi:hypothetical protein